MKKFAPIALLLILSASSFAQKTNEAIQRQIHQLKADKQISVTYDDAGKNSKIMGIGENFSAKEAKAAHVEAMNFGMAVVYPGSAISTTPEYIDLTFWVLTKKPQFAANAHWTAMLPGGEIDLGDPKYAAKARENMEYLNFRISRDDLTKIANQPNVRLKLGKEEFSFTAAHLKMFRDLLAVTAL